MTIRTEKNSVTSIILYPIDRLDTAAAPLLEKKIQQLESDITDITLDLSQLSYISSMGLRVLLQAKKLLNEQGKQFIVKNMSESVREVFEMTGFINLIFIDT